MALIMLCFMLIAPVQAAKYHLAANGDDSYDNFVVANPAYPWKTIARLNQVNLAPGDTIRFRRGDTFYGTVIVNDSGSYTRRVVFRPYGTGPLPVITGAKEITPIAWLSEAGGRYSAAAPAGTKLVFWDGQPMTCAREPDQGYYTITDSISPTVFADSTASAYGDWVRATAHIRTARWALASKRITAFNGTTKQFTLASAPVYGAKPGWGYFITHCNWALDSRNEWWMDSAAGRLRLIPPSGASPNAHAVTAVDLAYGFNIQSSYIFIESLAIHGYTKDAIYSAGGSRISIRGCDIRYADGAGIRIIGGTDFLIQGNSIYGSNAYGMITNAQNMTLDLNRIRAVALFDRLGIQGMGDLCCSGRGIDHTGTGSPSDITRNILDSIGYIGIGFTGHSTDIRNNLIDHVCLTKDDGAGIYTWSPDYFARTADYSTIVGNTVRGAVGAPDGTPDRSYVPGNGIYIDDRIKYVRVDSNTVAHCAWYGYHLHNTRYVTLRGNIAFANVVAGLAMNEDFRKDTNTSTYGMAENRIFGNTFASITADAATLHRGCTFPSSNMGALDSNIYWNALEPAHVSDVGIRRTLEGWRAASGQDLHTTGAFRPLPAWTIRDTLSGERVGNGSFDSTVSGWSAWPAASSVTVDSHPALDGRSLRALTPGDGASQPIVSSPVFPVRLGAQYLLRFSVVAPKPGKLTAVVRRAYSAWETRGLSRTVDMDSVRRDFSFVFRGSATDSPCRIDFAPALPDSNFHLDNVSLREVAADSIPLDGRLALFANPSPRDSVIALGASNWKDLKGDPVLSLTLAPFRSAVLFRDTGTGMPGEPGEDPEDGVSLSARPNPFNPAVAIEARGVPGPFRVTIFSPDGRKVADFKGAVRADASSRFIWNASKQASGIYLMRLEAGRRTLCRKLTLLR